MRIYAHSTSMCVCVCCHLSLCSAWSLLVFVWKLSERQKDCDEKMHDDDEEILCNTLWDVESTAGRSRGAKELVLINQQLKSQLTVSVVLIPSWFLAYQALLEFLRMYCKHTRPGSLCGYVGVCLSKNKKENAMYFGYSKLRHVRTSHFLSFYSSFGDIQAFKDTFFS